MNDKEHIYEDGKPRIHWLLALVILLFCPAAWAQEIPLHVLERPEVTINLLPSPCVDPVSLALATRGLPEPLLKDLKAIASNWLEKDGSRKDYAGCWLDMHHGFLVIFSDRTYDIIDKAEFKKTKGATGI